MYYSARTVILGGYLYKDFTVIEPTTDNPIRQYQPKVIKKYKCSNITDKYKPGFLNQHKYFLNLTNDNERLKFNPTKLNEVLFITKFIESIYD